MKLKKLIIHNIASIEDAVVDFEHGPLADDSRFLICGPTGAGKTTLLDAITLALYGTTPRLNAAEKEHYVDPEERFSKTKNDEAYIYDPRMLMRRGSFSAFVELLFTDKDDRPLKAIWSCSRAYNKADGSIKVPEWTLMDASDDAVISSKKTEVQTTIINRVGLTFDQFCRTTLLAQGDFTKFLKSDEDQKSEILEKLTGTGIYSEISKKIHSIKGEKDAVCESIKNQLGGVQLLTSDQLQEISRKRDELYQKINQLTQQEQQLSSFLFWYVQLERLETERQQAESACELHQKEIQTDTFQFEETLLDDWDRTVAQRDLWKNRVQANQILEEKQKEEEKLKTVYLDLCASLAGMQQSIYKKQEKKRKIVEYMTAEKPKEECYKQIELILSCHQQRMQAVEKVKDLESTIKNKNSDLFRLKEELVHEQAFVDKQKKDVQSKQNQLVTFSNQLAALDYEGLLDQRNQLDKQLEDLKSYYSLLEQITQLHLLTEEKVEALHTVEIQRKEIIEKRDEAEKLEKELETQLRKQQQIYDHQKCTCENMMKEYRSALIEGDICPLCGQRINHLTSDEHFVSLLQPVKEEVENVKAKWVKAGKIVAELKAQESTIGRDIIQKQKELLNAQTKEQQALTAKQTHSLFVLFENSKDPIKETQDHIVIIQIKLQQLNVKLKEVGSLQGMIASLQNEKNACDRLLRDSEKKVVNMEKQLAHITDALHAEQNQLDASIKLIEDMNGRISQYVDMVTYHNQGEEYLDELRKGAVVYQKATSLFQELGNELQRLDVEMKHILQTKDAVDKKMPSWTALVVSDINTKNNLDSAWLNLQTSISMNQATRIEAKQRFEEASDVLNAYFYQEQSVTPERLQYMVSLSAVEIDKLRKAHQKLKETMVGLRSGLESVRKNLEQHVSTRPAMDEKLSQEEIRKRLQETKETLNTSHQQLGQLLQHVETDKQNRKQFEVINRKLENAVRDAERWGHLHALFGSADGKKFRNIAQSYVLEQLLVSANQYLRQFTQRYEMECQAGSLTILLRDKEAGGVIRPTSTISGGEGFLISLSLALGLSSLSRASVSMDTLFIDEGFGTLDSSYLSAVMDALERLHHLGGKRIGIISHVESLKERLTTQIQVARVNNTLSKVTVVGI